MKKHQLLFAVFSFTAIVSCEKQITPPHTKQHQLNAVELKVKNGAL